MKKPLQGVVQEITQGLVLEMRNHQGLEGSAQLSIVDLLLQQLVKEVVKQLKEVSAGEGLSDEDLEAKLQKAERKLEKLAISAQDEDEVAGSTSTYPNLKYARPKYKNIESILKYVERDEDKGGVKLVIMNFND
ncbi:hypothetical protein ES703_33564 [subsurface metagenome]